jgi:hypothetical protein
MKPGRLVELTWQDANALRDQSDRHEVRAVPIPLVKTYGILMRDSKRSVVIAGEVIREPDRWSYRNTTVVPRGMVKKLRRIK